MNLVKITKSKRIEIRPNFFVDFKQGQKKSVSDHAYEILLKEGMVDTDVIEKAINKVEETKVLNPVSENKALKPKRKYTKRKKVTSYKSDASKSDEVTSDKTEDTDCEV